MAQDSTRHEVIPSARRLIRSLRDLGYDFGAAVADLIDNSIAAGATFVTVDVEFDGDDSAVRILDNGSGMTPSELREAMRYGAERNYDEGDLGKFGLGLKTASMSQCQRLSVATRANPNRADITTYCWDLAHIEKSNRWEILPLGVGPKTRQALKNTTGTVVMWQKLDRILGYKHPYGEMARKRLLYMCRQLEEHLAMVFHRFLSGEVPRKRLKISINGNPVQPWDPYCRKEANTKSLGAAIIPLDEEGVKGEIKLESFVLPHKEKFSTPVAFAEASGPSKWNRQQGFYVYRANRMIQSGGWCNLRTIDEHTKLARIALSFPPKLDEAFKINVAKMRVQLPQQIREQIEQAVTPVLRVAQETYRKGSATSDSKVRVATTRVGTTEGVITPFGSKRLWTLDDLQKQIERTAEPEERPVVDKVFRRFRDQTNS
ncbi:MAG: hypothetical protein JWM21_108 [Acidobacteria bacterium]|nr:hypothetical protein [Acidobacteriota bacterium]